MTFILSDKIRKYTFTVDNVKKRFYIHTGKLSIIKFTKWCKYLNFERQYNLFILLKKKRTISYY